MPDMNLTETLHSPASWTNRAGRIDRSACLVVRTRDVKHLTFGQRQRLDLRGYHLRTIHRNQLPLQTAGDHRTRKSNALKNRHKLDLFLPPHWSQTLRIIRCKLHARLTQHFLICPGCGSASSNQKSEITNPKFLKLYLPLCTAAEWRDVNIVRMILSHAAPWSLGLPSQSLHPVMPPQVVSRLIHRYQPLLFRGLLCRQCLGLRYGEVKRPDASQKVQCDILSPDWAKNDPAYYQSLPLNDRVNVSELFNIARIVQQLRTQWNKA